MIKDEIKDLTSYNHNYSSYSCYITIYMHNPSLILTYMLSKVGNQIVQQDTYRRTCWKSSLNNNKLKFL